MNGFERKALQFGGFTQERIEAFQAYEAEKVALTEAAAKVEKVKVTLGEATLEDGVVIYFPGEELTEGSVIYSDEAQEEAVGAADWTLENGDVITTGDDGAVTNIAVADAPEEDGDVEAEAELAGSLEELLAVMSEFNERLSTLEGANADLKKENTDLKANAVLKEDELKAEATKVETLSKVTSAKPNVANQKQETFTMKPKHKLRGFKPLKN